MEFRVSIPFVDLLGCELIAFDDGEAELALTLRPELCNSWNVAHGGVTMTLLDVAMAHAARSPDAGGAAEPRNVVTIEMKTSFMRPGLGRLIARGRRLHRTASLAFCEASVLDGEGRILAHGTGTFKYLTGLAVDGRRIERHDASD